MEIPKPISNRITSPQRVDSAWVSVVHLPTFANCRTRWSPYGEQPDRRTDRQRSGWFELRWHGDDREAPPAFHDAAKAAFETLFENEDDMHARIVAEILQGYRTYCRQTFARELADAAIAERIDSEAGIIGTIELSCVHLLQQSREGFAYLGLEFNSTWADDHGVGAILHGTRVVTVESADVVWCFRGEAESPMSS